MADVAEDLAARARLLVGRTINRKYRVEAVIGIGGMATVYAATHRNGRRVALKLLHPEIAVQGDIRHRFLREGQAANMVSHPGVVAVIDDDIAEDGSPFLVMELLDGQSVEQLWLEQGRLLPTEMVLAIGHEVCDVLTAAHRAGIIHRDLKPGNLFITREGALKVLDFGIARVRPSAEHGTATGLVFGTPAFMSPEQASGRTSQVDVLTDIWAAGATLFTLLSGLPVHEGESNLHVTVLAATRPARSLAAVLPSADARLVTVVDRALAFEKSVRWPSAAAMRTAIRDASVALFGRPPALRGSSDTIHVDACHLPKAGPPRTLPLRAPSARRTSIIVAPITGAPVSSTAPTRRLRGGRMRQLATTFALAVECLRVLRRRAPGRTARSKETSSGNSTVTRTTAIVIGVGACSTLLAVVGNELNRQPSTLDQPVDRVAASAVLATDTGVDQVRLAETPSSSQSVAAPASAAPAKPRAPVHPAPRHAAASSVTSSKPDCTQVYTVTAEGKKRWKPECL